MIFYQLSFISPSQFLSILLSITKNLCSGAIGSPGITLQPYHSLIIVS